MRIRLGVAAIAVALASSGCAFLANEPPADPSVAFCDAIADYAGAVLDLRSLDEQATIDDYKAAATAVANALAEVVKVGVSSGQAKLSDLETATETLVSTVQDLPQDVPIADIQAQLQQQLTDVAKARASLGLTVCTPSASSAPSPAAS